MLWSGHFIFPCSCCRWPLTDFLESYQTSKSILVVSRFSKAYAVWFCVALLVSGFIEWRMLKQSQKRQDRALFGTLLTLFLAVSGLVVYTYFIQDQDSLEPGRPLETVLMLWSVVPSALLGYFIFRHNFLEIAIRRSFGYPCCHSHPSACLSGQCALSARLSCRYSE